MNKELRQKILKELKSLLNEQPESAVGLDLGKDEQQQILNSPTEVANFITNQNKSIYTNLDEATFTLKALSTINSREKAVEFLAQWKKLNGEESIQLNGNFFGSGKNTQKQIKDMGLKIQQMAAGTDTPSTSPVNKDMANKKGDAPAAPPSLGTIINSKRSAASIKPRQDVKNLQKLINQYLASDKNKLESKSLAPTRLDTKGEDGIYGNDTKTALDLIFKSEKKGSRRQYTINQMINILSQINTGNSPVNESYDQNTRPFEESKDFYDNKKLNEAKQLFDKLLKKL